MSRLGIECADYGGLVAKVVGYAVANVENDGNELDDGVNLF